MNGDMIMKWVVTKSKKSNHYIIKEVYVNLEDFNDKSKFVARCFYKDDLKKELILEKKGLYSKNIAKIRMKERKITRDFKEKNKDMNGNWTCSCCWKTIFEKEDCTIDHKRPKSSFKKVDGLMTKEDWYICWNENNLQILCHKCNQRKRSISIKKNKQLTSKSNKLRKRIRKQKGRLKNKVRFGIKSKDENAFELARRDSNYIDVKCFFYKEKKDNIKKK